MGKVTVKSLSGHSNDLGDLGSVGASADHKARLASGMLDVFLVEESDAGQLVFIQSG